MKKGYIFGIKTEDGPRAILGGKYKHSWVEETIVIKKEGPAESLNRPTRNYLGIMISRKQWRLLLMIISAAVSVIIFRVGYLQLFKGAEMRTMAEGNRIRINPIVSERGIIYDRFHKELVQNIPDFSLTAVPQDLPTNEDEKLIVINEVSKLSGVPTSAIHEILDKYQAYSYASLVIKENVEYETAIKMYIESNDLPGINIEKGSKRKYLYASHASSSSALSSAHILGYLGKLSENELNVLKNGGYLPFDNIGKVGIEKAYEKELRGSYGRKKVEVDARGREQTVLAEEAPVPGKNIILSLDIQAQVELERAIMKQLDLRGKKRAAAIAMNPNNGEIIALINIPAFDNNDFAGGISSARYSEYANDKNRPLFNRAIAGSYPSGSIIKPIIAAGALQENLITPRTTVASNGGLRVGKWFFKDWQPGGHGITNVTKAIAWSVNTFFYHIGGGYANFDGLGITRLTRYLRSYRMGSKTGIDIPGESSGFVPSPEWKREIKNEPWYIGDTYNLSIGQGDLLVTPLQAAVWTSAVANGGSIVTPHLARAIEDTAADTTQELKFAVSRGPISSANMAVARQGMRDCVTAGSCKLLQSLPFASGGKTGTAQWSSARDAHAWFAAFAPLEKPQIVVVVLVEEGIQGSAIAMPIARDFLGWWGKKYLK